MNPSADTIARDQVYLSLAPFFLEAAGNSASDARAAAEAAVASLHPTTMDEFFLAAQIVVYNLASFDSLRWSKEKPDLAPSTALRLRGNANAMHRAAMQCRKALDQRRKAAAAPGAADPTPTPERTDTEADVREAVRRAAAVLAETREAIQPKPAMNRAARRAAKIQAQRAQRAAA